MRTIVFSIIITTLQSLAGNSSAFTPSPIKVEEKSHEEIETVYGFEYLRALGGSGIGSREVALLDLSFEGLNPKDFPRNVQMIDGKTCGPHTQEIKEVPGDQILSHGAYMFTLLWEQTLGAAKKYDLITIRSPEDLLCLAARKKHYDVIISNVVWPVIGNMSLYVSKVVDEITRRGSLYLQVAGNYSDSTLTGPLHLSDPIQDTMYWAPPNDVKNMPVRPIYFDVAYDQTPVTVTASWKIKTQKSYELGAPLRPGAPGYIPALSSAVDLDLVIYKRTDDPKSPYGKEEFSSTDKQVVKPYADLHENETVFNYESAKKVLNKGRYVALLSHRVSGERSAEQIKKDINPTADEVRVVVSSDKYFPGEKKAVTLFNADRQNELGAPQNTNTVIVSDISEVSSKGGSRGRSPDVYGLFNAVQFNDDYGAKGSSFTNTIVGAAMVYLRAAFPSLTIADVKSRTIDIPLRPTKNQWGDDSYLVPSIIHTALTKIKDWQRVRYVRHNQYGFLQAAVDDWSALNSIHATVKSQSDKYRVFYAVRRWQTPYTVMRTQTRRHPDQQQQYWENNYVDVYSNVLQQTWQLGVVGVQDIFGGQGLALAAVPQYTLGQVKAGTINQPILRSRTIPGKEYTVQVPEQHMRDDADVQFHQLINDEKTINQALKPYTPEDVVELYDLQREMPDAVSKFIKQAKMRGESPRFWQAEVPSRVND